MNSPPLKYGVLAIGVATVVVGNALFHPGLIETSSPEPTVTPLPILPQAADAQSLQFEGDSATLLDPDEWGRVAGSHRRHHQLGEAIRHRLHHLGARRRALRPTNPKDGVGLTGVHQPMQDLRCAGHHDGGGGFAGG